MRLIDADALKKIIDRKESWILELIDEEPTAYDVEKVVAELEEEESKSLKKCKEEIELFKEEFWRGRMTALQNATDIVRKGGVE